MPPPKKRDSLLEIPPFPPGIWQTEASEATALDLTAPRVVQFSNKPNAKFPGKPQQPT